MTAERDIAGRCRVRFTSASPTKQLNLYCVNLNRMGFVFVAYRGLSCGRGRGACCLLRVARHMSNGQDMSRGWLVTRRMQDTACMSLTVTVTLTLSATVMILCSLLVLTAVAQN